MAVQPPGVGLLPVLRPLHLIVDGSVLRLGRLCDLIGAAAGSVSGIQAVVIPYIGLIHGLLP